MARETGGARPRLLWVPLVVLLALAGGYALAAWWTSTRVPNDVSVAGVDVGGMSEGRARATLEDGLVERAALPVRLDVAGTAQTIDPAAAGLAVDLDATMDELVGLSFDPRDLWDHFTGGGRVDPVLDVDRDALTGQVEQLAGQVAAEPADGAVGFEGTTAVPVAPVRGVELDVDGSVEAVLAGWPQAGAPIELPAEVDDPAIGQEQVDAVMASFATPALAGPVVVAVGDTRVTLEPAQVAPALSVVAEGDQLVGRVDGEALRATLVDEQPALQVAPLDAGFVLRGNGPVVVPAENGTSVDPAALAEAFQAAIATPERTATVPAAVVEPELTTAEAEALGVTQVVSQFATNLTDNAGRTENITIAARTVSGTVLLPGETFSLNATLGERTPAKGYNEAPVIVNGRLTLGHGGGVSQVATTLFNGMFFAGLDEVEHKPHSFYISRYPEGREATVNWNNVDLKFTNDSGYGVLIEMWVGGGQVHTRFWSTKVWDVEAVKGPRTNVKQPGSDTGSGPDCVEQSPQVGFDVTVTRIFKQGGAEKKRETFRTRYIPEDRITCTP